MDDHPGPGYWPWQDRSGGVSPLRAATFALMLYPTAWTLYHLATGGFGPLPMVGLIYWSGVWATVLLLAALAITPLCRIFRWRRLVGVRRMVGVSALLYTLAHVVIYAGLYRWDLAFLLRDIATRPTLIVATASTLGLLALGATSFDAAVRRMGGRAWKRLHRTNYLLTGLAILHFLLSPGIFSMQYLLAGVYIWLMAWRWLDRRGRGAQPGALLWLAFVCAGATALVEAGWIWAYHGGAPLETLSDNVTLILGITATWWVLALGLLIALGPGIVGAVQAGRRVGDTPPDMHARNLRGRKNLVGTGPDDP